MSPEMSSRRSNPWRRVLSLARIMSSLIWFAVMVDAAAGKDAQRQRVSRTGQRQGLSRTASDLTATPHSLM